MHGIPASASTALALLLEGYDAARALGRSPWDLALSLHSLRAAGLTEAGLLWLVYQDFVAYAVETTRPGRSRRTFRRLRNITFTDRLCLVLTEAGAACARAARPDSVAPSPEGKGAGQAPRWDGVLRELWVGRTMVKRFRRPAPNQECVLATFEEQGWPPRIDDPLSHPFDEAAKERLHDTIKNLNRHQVPLLVRFQGDGTGRGVCWRLDAHEHPERTG